MSGGMEWARDEMEKEEQAAAAKAKQERNKTRYTPGQRLNSAAEVMQALLDRQALHHLGGWSKHEFIQLKDGRIVDERGETYDPSLCDGYWSIYTPPKRRVKSERWFAVFLNRYGIIDWSRPCETRDCVVIGYPNALAYHCATVEVEVEDVD